MPKNSAALPGARNLALAPVEHLTMAVFARGDGELLEELGPA